MTTFEQCRVDIDEAIKHLKAASILLKRSGIGTKLPEVIKALSESLESAVEPDEPEPGTVVSMVTGKPLD